MVSIFFVENTVLTNENGVYVVSLSPDVTKNKGIKSKCEISETVFNNGKRFHTN